MSSFSNFSLCALIAAVALVSTAPVEAASSLSNHSFVIDHILDVAGNGTRLGGTLPERQSTADLGTSRPITPDFGHGGINPVGDVTCEDALETLQGDDYHVISTDCVWYIYKFRAIQGSGLFNISLSSHTGDYTATLIGIVD